MATAEAFIDYDYTLNTSLQVGDLLYCACISSNDGFKVNTANPVLFGRLVEIGINPNRLYFSYSGFGVLPDTIPCPPKDTRFLMFSKDKAVNEASLKGYYNLVTFINDDKEREAELFVVNSETGFSSK